MYQVLNVESLRQNTFAHWTGAPGRELDWQERCGAKQFHILDPAPATFGAPGGQPSTAQRSTQTYQGCTVLFVNQSTSSVMLCSAFAICMCMAQPCLLQY